MWYAIAPDLAFEVPAPVPVVRVVQKTAKPPIPDNIYRLPALFWRPVTLPKQYVTSERGAIRYICHQLHIQYRFSGPNYALYGAGVSFNQRKPAIVLLMELAHVPYIQSHFAVQTHPSQQVVVRNTWLPGMTQ